MLKGHPGYTVYGRGCLGMAAEPADGISSSGQPADVITNQLITLPHIHLRTETRRMHSVWKACKIVAFPPFFCQLKLLNLSGNIV